MSFAVSEYDLQKMKEEEKNYELKIIKEQKEAN